jgi:hypothetical protein
MPQGPADMSKKRNPAWYWSVEVKQLMEFGYLPRINLWSYSLLPKNNLICYSNNKWN